MKTLNKFCIVKVLLLIFLITPNLGPALSTEKFALDAFFNKDSLQINIGFQPGLALYKDKILVVNTKTKENINDQIAFPNPVDIDDEYGEKTEGYTQPLSLDIAKTILEDSINITFQGCSLELEMCYLPVTKQLSWDKKYSQVIIEDVPTTSLSKLNRLNEKSNISDTIGTIEEKPTIKILGLTLAFFLLGFTISFTPCTLPILPILFHSIKRHGGKKYSNISIAFSYVVGMACAYSALGLFVSIIHAPIQIYMQQNIVVYSFSLLLICLAFVELGIIKLPESTNISNAIYKFEDKLSNGLYTTFIMGLFSVLIISPCTTPALASLLLAITQMNASNLLVFIWFFLFGAGAGIPLMLVALYGEKSLPKTGMWMNYIKDAFGFMILAIATWLVTRISSPWTAQLLWTVYTSAVSTFLVLKPTYKKSIPGITTLLIFLILSVYLGFATFKNNIVLYNDISISYILTNNEESFKSNLQKAKRRGQKVVIKVDAAWCTYCKELDANFFSKVSVIDYFDTNNIVLIKADVTSGDSFSKYLTKEWHVKGLPTLIFINSSGNEYARLFGETKETKIFKALSDE